MAFTGKATYAAGADLPEIMEDVSDLISIVSPYETPLLDHLGDPARSALSTVHEWVEDTLLPNTDAVNQTTFTPNAQDATSITVNNGSRFQIGDLVRPGRSVCFWLQEVGSAAAPSEPVIPAWASEQDEPVVIVSAAMKALFVARERPCAFACG